MSKTYIVWYMLFLKLKGPMIKQYVYLLFIYTTYTHDMGIFRLGPINVYRTSTFDTLCMAYIVTHFI